MVILSTYIKACMHETVLHLDPTAVQLYGTVPVRCMAATVLYIEYYCSNARAQLVACEQRMHSNVHVPQNKARHPQGRSK